jgi:CBS domain-containing protein
MNLRNVLSKKGADVQTIDAAQSLSEAIARFSRSKVRCLVVTAAGKVEGVLTIRDALLHLDREGANALSQSVREAMTKDVVFVTPESTLDEAHELFGERGINHLPVLDDGQLVGLVTRVDLLTSQALSAEEVNAYMLEYISGSYF